MKFSKKEIFTIPNILTYIRILLVPVFVWLMVDTSKSWYLWVALGIFIFAELTDLADGYIARRFNQVSDIGKILDPIADKILQVTTIICLVIIGHVHIAFAIIIFAKELYMVLGALLVLKLAGKDVEISANVQGKIASALFSVGIIMAFFHIEKLKYLFYIDWVVLGVACAFAIYAAVNYTILMVKAILAVWKKQKEEAGVDSAEETEISHSDAEAEEDKAE